MDNLEEDDIVKLSMQKLALAAEYYSGVCAQISRYYMKERQAVSENFSGVTQPANTTSCRHCGSIFRPGNSTVKTIGKLKLNKKLKKLLDRQQMNKHGRGRLSKKEKELCDMYSSAGTRLAVKCLCCGNRSVKKFSNPRSRLKKHNLKKPVLVTNEHGQLSKSKKKKLKRLQKRQEQNRESQMSSSQGMKAEQKRQSAKNIVSTSNVTKTVNLKKELNVKATKHLKTLPALNKNLQQPPPKTSASKKKKMSALGKLLEKEKANSKSSSNSLANFLSNF